MVVVRWTPGGEGSGFETGPGRCVLRHGEVDEILGDNLAMDCHSREGEAILLIASCHIILGKMWDRSSRFYRS